MRQLRTMDDACGLIDDWIAAYRELKLEFNKLQSAQIDIEWERNYYRDLLRHLDPFLPPSMQDEKARTANPAIYEAIREIVLEENETVPF